MTLVFEFRVSDGLRFRELRYDRFRPRGHDAMKIKAPVSQWNLVTKMDKLLFSLMLLPWTFMRYGRNYVIHKVKIAITGTSVLYGRGTPNERLHQAPHEDDTLNLHYTPSISIGPTQELPFKRIEDAFRYHTQIHPYNTAIEQENESLDYAELDRASDIAAAELLAEGISPGTRVCLLVERSISMVIAILAILKVGGAYVPVDGGIIADEALEIILEDSKPGLLLCSTKYLSRGANNVLGIKALTFEQLHLRNELQASKFHEKLNQVHPSEGTEAYVIYTSGTTGKPKGVSISHINVINVLSTFPGNLGIKPGTRVSQLLNIAFDMCVWEVLGSLINGGTLHMRQSGVPIERWKGMLSKVDVMIATPSILSHFEPTCLPNLRVVATAGEPCSKELADKWIKAGKIFYNCYGPTEATIINTVHYHELGKAFSIGFPTPNNSVYVLNEHMKPVNVGETGILWAGGLGVSRGYLNQPQLTAAKFKSDLFVNQECSLMYNTGDLGRMNPDGSIQHLGRLDDQVKIKGFRVELDGVAASMAECTGVAQAAALCIQGRLWGFYVKDSNRDITPDDLKAFLQGKQSYYAIPSRYVSLQNMPLTQNGKVDKRRLAMIAGDIGEI